MGCLDVSCAVLWSSRLMERKRRFLNRLAVVRCRTAGKGHLMHGSFTIPVVCPTVVGRTPELASLRSLMEEAQRGLGQVALICGEAGIGKSRLLSEMKTYATEHGFYLLQGQCFPADRACPYAPLLDLVRSDVPAPSTDLVAEMGSLALALFPLLPDLIPPPSDLPPLPPLDAEQEQHRLFAALAKLLLSANHPTTATADCGGPALE